MSYLKYLAGGLIAMIASLAAINLVVDPYDIWESPVAINGFNALKPEVAAHQRRYETALYRKAPAATLILGTSRADVGLDPEHPALSQPAFNLAMSQQPLDETLALIEKAGEVKPLNTVVFATDFFTANINLKPPADAVDANYSLDDYWRSLLATDSLLASIKTVLAQRTYDPGSAGDIWTARGLRVWTEQQERKKGGARKSAISSELIYANHVYLPMPRRAFALSGEAQDSAATYIAILRTAHKKGIDLRILISPSHARQWQLVAALRLWKTWEEWKRMIVRLNEAVARETGGKPFDVWDFSGFHAINSEDFPSLCDKETTMRWYWESSHYKPALGNLVLDRVFDRKNAALPADFGMKLSGKNIDAHLKNIRADHELWRISHPIDVAEVERAANADRSKSLVAMNQQCP